MKPGASAVVIDWIPEKAIFGKAMGWPLPLREMQRLCEGIGFTFAQELQTGSVYHYGLLFRK